MIFNYNNLIFRIFRYFLEILSLMNSLLLDSLPIGQSSSLISSILWWSISIESSSSMGLPLALFASKLKLKEENFLIPEL